MTPEEIEVGNKWLTILNNHAGSDFASRSLFQSTAKFLQSKGQKIAGGVKREPRFKKVVLFDAEKAKEILPEKKVSLLEAAKIREEEDSNNLLALSENDDIPNVKKTRRKKND